MKDMVLEGGDAFGRSHGAMKLFDYMGTDERFSKLINQTGITIAVVKKALEVYEGFQGVNVLVDVGGVGINLDLTCVVPWDKHLLTPNVEHVAGDMFIDVPTGDAMILKASSTIHFYFLKAYG
ncbi:PREDICTED: caffeic acid 3-O-methyltransferase-like [Brassica oleracea var. oleracea]|uniref:caffeic acid 3-O-methyltransferase-like n=1 Tax=Brassica oleracea var. oleracea TaxID=109376 RepID=UPI0006A6A7AE|nr:PREDICTED: caffeic acid 3-O-methyltransferase-like [Brassica oleracea var. oleracea]